MKTEKLLLILIRVAFIFCINSCTSILKVSKYEIQKDYIIKNIQIRTPIKFSVVQTGNTKTQKAFVYKGGSLIRQKKLSHIAVWVKHPKGNFLFDSGLGDNIDVQVKEMSFLEKLLFSYHKEKSVRQQLIENNTSTDTIKTIILSHLHWDHASGIVDFPRATISTTKEEYNFALSENAHVPAFLKTQYSSKEIKWNFLDFKPVPYECFEKSYDYFEDGSVVFVKLPGHTPGSLGMFLNMQNGKRYFFTGDVTWSLEGFLRPSAKNNIASGYVDQDKERIKKTIVLIHNLMKKDPTLIVIPAHDFNAQKKLPHFPVFEE